MLKSLLASLSLITLTSPVMASTYQDHVDLAVAIARTGINVKINPAECDNAPYFGWYSGFSRELVVCQEKRIRGVREEVQWTAEDYDTLRHEAHHVVQDCKGDGFNNILTNVYTNVFSVAKNEIGMNGIAGVITNYEKQGHHIVLMEIEAFSVAAMNDPQEQVRDVQTYCM